MYHHHYGLSGAPFPFSPAPGALYLGKTHREGLAALEWSLLHEPTGFTVLVGESGVGKTTLASAVIARCYPNVHIARVGCPKLDFDQMMQAMLEQLQRGARCETRLQMVESFARLVEQLPPAERVVIVVDEAQELSDQALEEFRLLSNIDAAPQRRLQIVFIGQLELIARLATPRLESLNQRIGARVMLEPLDADEVREYVDCRLRARGGATKKIFAPAALEHLVRHSRGVPRRINVLCHNSMLLGFVAGRRRVNLAMARAAVDEFDNLLGAKAPAQAQLERPPRRGSLGRAALAAAVLVLAALGALYVWSSQGRFGLEQMHASLRGESMGPAFAPSLPDPQIWSWPAPLARAAGVTSSHCAAGARS